VSHKTLFSVIYLTTHYVVNIIVCKMFCLFINNNLKYSVNNKLCYISSVLHRQPEKLCTIAINKSVVQIVIPMLTLQSWTLYLL